MSDESFIEFRNVTKRFAGVTALSNVSLTIRRGECHALMGENGAGKSTLGKILAGIYKPDGGEIFIDGKQRHFHSPADAKAAGVGMVHQELAFVPQMSVAENLTLGQTPRKLGLLVDHKAMRARAGQLLHHIGVTSEQINPDQPMHTLSTAQEQMVQIAAAVGSGANVLVFDEPTSSLSETEVRHLFGLIDELKSRGVTIIYVSHRLPELFRLTDRISVLRDGTYVGTLVTPQATEDELVRMMVGRSVTARTRKNELAADAKVLLEVASLSSPGKFEDIHFNVKAGEILGIAGLVGAGRSEIANAIFGLDSQASGRIRVAGKDLKIGSIRASKRAGIGLVPEDRKRQGLVLMMGGRENCTLAMLPAVSTGGVLRQSRERKIVRDLFSALNVKTPGMDTPVAGLSGGNQQKVVIAKWLAARGSHGQVLIVDEPTRGVDVGAKAAIHDLLFDLARNGMAVVMISSELPELLNVASRIIVMRQGRLVGEIPAAEATQEILLRSMTGRM